MNLGRNRAARLFLALWFAIVTVLPGAAQDFSFGGARPLQPEQAFQIELRGVTDGRAEIGWRIEPGYYLYRDHLSASTADGAPLAIETGSGVAMDDPNFGAVEVYYDDAALILPRAGGEVAITWQGCQEGGICYAPITSHLTLPALPAGMGDATSDTALQLDQGGGLVAGLAGRGGAALVLLAFFGFGLALAFTPCVLPMVPILAGTLARQGETLTPARGALMSGAYVLAMAVAFGVFGAFAGWSGQNLQMVLQSPWAVGAVAVLFVVLALSSFGLFQIQLPAGFVQRISGGQGRRGTVSGAAALGFTSALIVGPCITAPLAGALLYIAQTGDVALGAGALFVLGLGQGVPLFAAGVLGARVLPRAGAWMESVRNIFGFVFLGLAIWLGGRLLPGPVVLLAWGLLLAGGAVFMGALDRLNPGAGPRARMGQLLGVVALFSAGLLGIGASLGAHDPLRPLAPLLSAREAADPLPDFAQVRSGDDLRAALANGPDQPSMIYITADWCVTCKGIERNILPDPRVTEALAEMRLIKADVTRLDGEGQALMEMLGAAGPPTMIFLNDKAQEPDASRLIGTVRAGDVQASVRAAKGGV